MRNLYLIAIVIISGIAGYTSKDSNGWKNVPREYKTIGNITYYFPSETSLEQRNFFIKQCQNSIKFNLRLIGETEFTNEMDIEFVNTREDMLRYTGLPAQGMAMFQQNVFYSLLKAENSPIQHEMMHMIAKYKWGDSEDWIDEGLATYTGGLCTSYSLEEIYTYYLQSGKLISMDALVNNFFNNPDMIAYTQSAFIVKYLIDNYGLDKFKALWQNGFISFEKVYGFKFSNVQEIIQDELKKKYPKNIDFDWDTFNKGC